MANAQTIHVQKKGKRLLSIKKHLPLYLMALPGLLYLFINNYMPLPGLVLAFKNYNARKGIYGSDWAGFDNFKFLFSTQDAFVITRNTFVSTALCMAFLTREIWLFILSAL